MANEKRLIDALDLVIKLAKNVGVMVRNGKPQSEIYSKVLECIADSPTVEAVVLPCEVGTQIWLTEWRCSGMRWLKLSEPKPRTINHFDITKDGLFAHFKDGYVKATEYDETWFLSKEEAKAALAKMDGGNEDGT